LFSGQRKKLGRTHLDLPEGLGERSPPSILILRSEKGPKRRSEKGDLNETS